MNPTADRRRIFLARSLRAFADGYVAILLPLHLSTLGLAAFAVGAIATAALLGSALLTLALGITAHRVRRRPALLGAALLMAAATIAAGAGIDWTTRDTLVIARVNTAPTLDGVLDDAMWAKAPPHHYSNPAGREPRRHWRIPG